MPDTALNPIRLRGRAASTMFDILTGAAYVAVIDSLIGTLPGAAD
jgi:hypothetical protein